MELNNPLRSKPARTLPAQDEPTLNVAVKTVEVAPAITPEVKQATIATPAPRAEPKTAVSAMIPHSIEVNGNPELKRAMELLARHGIETSAPKKNYVKHSYEIEEELHDEFHAMYPILGFKHVKTAINDAIRMWCDENRKEFNRRSG